MNRWQRDKPRVGDGVYIEGRDPLWYRVMEYHQFHTPKRDEWKEGENLNAEVIDVYGDVVLVQHYAFDKYGVEAMDLDRFDDKYHPEGENKPGFWRVWDN